MIDKRTAPFGALLLRVCLGAMFLMHSLYLKLVVFTLPGTVKFFESLGLPGFATHLTIAVEAVGGLMLVAGFKTRYAAATVVQALLGDGAYSVGARVAPTEVPQWQVATRS